MYYDGQFDDARLLVNLAADGGEHGAALLNYARGDGASRKDATASSTASSRATWRAGASSGRRREVVINATGAFARRRAAARRSRGAAADRAEPGHSPRVRPVVPARATSAIMVPHTSDGRVMFAIPWHGHTVVGTTDTPIAERDARAAAARAARSSSSSRPPRRYLHKAPTRADVLSVFAGIRPLVRRGDGRITAALSRDHTIHIDPSGLLTITGGKWTTYRNMAEDTRRSGRGARAAAGEAVRDAKPEHPRLPSATRSSSARWRCTARTPLPIRELARADPALGEPLDPALPCIGAEVVWAAREEMARTVEDVLARRMPRAVPERGARRSGWRRAAARLLARELGRDDAWQRSQVAAFETLARGYMVS